MIIDKLVALLGYELDESSEDAKQDYEKGLQDITEGVTKLGNFAKKGAVLVGTLTAGIGLLVNQTTNATDELGKFAAANDLSFEALQRLNFAGGIYGGTNETITASLRAVNEKLGEFKRGAGDFELLAQLGVSVQGADSIEFIERLADRFEGLDATRAQDLGRKLGIDENFVQLLRDGGDNLRALYQEADELGIVLGGEVAANSAEFIDSQFRLSSILNAVKAQVVNGVIPVWIDAADSLTEFIKQNRELINEGLTDFLEVVVTLSKLLFSAINALFFVFNRFALAVGDTKTAIFLLIGAYTALKLVGGQTLLALLLGTKKLSLAATIMNAKILLIPVLIGAAIAVALLVLDDFFTFLRGGDSLIGDMVEHFVAWKEEFRQINDFAENIAKIMDGIGSAVGGLGEFVGNTAGRVVAIASGGEQRDFAINEIKESSQGFFKSLIDNETLKKFTPFGRAFNKGAGVLTNNNNSSSTTSTTTITDSSTTDKAEINVNVYGANDPTSTGQVIGQTVNGAVKSFNVHRGTDQ